MSVHLTMEQRRLARRLHARGLSLREVGRQVGCSLMRSSGRWCAGSRSGRCGRSSDHNRRHHERNAAHTARVPLALVRRHAGLAAEPLATTLLSTWSQVRFLPGAHMAPDLRIFGFPRDGRLRSLGTSEMRVSPSVDGAEAFRGCIDGRVVDSGPHVRLGHPAGPRTPHRRDMRGPRRSVPVPPLTRDARIGVRAAMPGRAGLTESDRFPLLALDATVPDGRQPAVCCHLPARPLRRGMATSRSGR